MIATSRQSANRAIVPPIREGLRHALATQARLRRSARINPDQLPTGAFSLVGKHCNEHRPSRIVNGLRQHSGAQSLHVQILDGNHAVLIDQLPREFMLKVGPLVHHVYVGPLEQLHSLASPIASLLSPRHFALASPQTGLRVPVVPGVLNLRAIDQHGETVQPHVDPGSAVAGGKWLRRPLQTEAHEPSARFAFNGGSLNRALDGTVQVHLDVPSPMHADTSVGEETATRWMLRERDAVVPARGAIPREPWALPTLASRKERLKRLVHTMQDILCALCVHQRQAPVRTHGGQLAALVVEVNRLAANLPCANPFFEGGIVQSEEDTSE